jgi:hypothetical protein
MTLAHGAVSANHGLRRLRHQAASVLAGLSQAPSKIWKKRFRQKASFLSDNPLKSLKTTEAMSRKNLTKTRIFVTFA